MYICSCNIKNKYTVRYSVTNSTHESIILYGINIKMTESNNLVQEDTINDICSDYDEVCNLCKTMARCKVTPTSIHDIIDDFLVMQNTNV